MKIAFCFYGLYILTEVVQPQTPAVLSSSNPTSAAVIAIISDSYFMPLGQISGWRGFAIE